MVAVLKRQNANEKRTRTQEERYDSQYRIYLDLEAGKLTREQAIEAYKLMIQNRHWR